MRISFDPWEQKLVREWNNMGYSVGRDDDGYICPLSPVVHSKTDVMTTHLHYSDPTARQERTVFGKARKGLFYNYSDRLQGESWRQGWDLAKKQGLTPGTALFYECVLNHFHESDDVNLEHVILGCNMSNGYDYLVFGYTYTSKTNK